MGKKDVYTCIYIHTYTQIHRYIHTHRYTDTYIHMGTYTVIYRDMKFSIVDNMAAPREYYAK